MMKNDQSHPINNPSKPSRGWIQLFCLYFTLLIALAACSPALQPTSSASRVAITEQEITLLTGGETILTLQASAPGTDWASRNAEAATISIQVDGVYKADVVLHQGARSFGYQVMLGNLGAGTHKVAIFFEPTKSSAQAGEARVEKLTTRVYPPTDPLFPIIAHAPYLYGRDESNYSDTPLLTYHEVNKEGATTTITYSIIFSNEDGGTAYDGLMARWGRLVDIEWFYRVTLNPNGEITREEYQAQNHATNAFKGVKEDRHPFLKDVTRNNVFGDSGSSRFRFTLPPVDALVNASREEMLDLHPWMYRVMSEEWLREQPQGTEKEAKPTTREVSDPRNYAYLEYRSGPQAGQTCDGKLAFQLKLKGSETWYASDHGVDSLRIQSEGWHRTTIELPAGTNSSQVEALRVMMYPGNNRACALTFTDVRKLFLLGQDTLPGANLLAWNGNQSLDADPATTNPDQLTIPAKP